MFDPTLSKEYKSHSQIIRVLSEQWVKQEIYCPSCASSLQKYENNRPAADFFCPHCKEEYELKSKKDSMGKKIVDGAYTTMIERLQSSNNPNFFFLNYTLKDYCVINFMVIPKHFFVPEIIEKRPPLTASARRAHWVGCNIILKNIPQAGKIFYIRDARPEPQNLIMKNWQKALFLRKEKKIESRGWLLDIMKCIDSLPKQEFTLAEMYSFEKALSKKYPENHHIKDKIRQQLQFLRDMGYLEFVNKGLYRTT